MSIEKATFGAGCFWGVEAAFAAIPGVTATAVGYEGGSLERPSYQDVCTDQTGHAEVVELDFDPAQVSYEQLLDAFFAFHDPTTLNRQGPDWARSTAPPSSSTPPGRRRRPAPKSSSSPPRAASSPSASSPKLSPRKPSGAPRSTTSATWKNAARQAATFSKHQRAISFSVAGRPESRALLQGPCDVPVGLAVLQECLTLLNALA